MMIDVRPLPARPATLPVARLSLIMALTILLLVYSA